jgi:hypothetical protein
MFFRNGSKFGKTCNSAASRQHPTKQLYHYNTKRKETVKGVTRDCNTQSRNNIASCYDKMQFLDGRLSTIKAVFTYIIKDRPRNCLGHRKIIPDVLANL